MKKKSSLNFTEINSIPQLIKDFLNDKFPEFREDSFSLDNFKEKIENKRNNFSDKTRRNLCNVLETQLQDLNLSQSQQENLSLLQNKNTLTVTTGHQLNLFSGPVFFVYKILQTIKTAVYLKKNFPEDDFVPVFWMATEDHDFEEINHFKTSNNFYEFKANSGGAVGKIKLEDLAFISSFEEEFKDDIFGTELIMLLKKAYQKGETLTSATRFLVNELLSHYGLIMIDGDDKILKTEMKSVFKAELLTQDLFNYSKNAIQKLTDLYGKVQVNPREINLFYLSETRNRIEFDGENYLVLDTDLKFTKEEILEELEQNPEKFSPNAVLRPAFQESVLPNVAYIGGNAEIMYWLELKDFFKKIELDFPILVPRNSMLWLSEKVFSKLDKLHLNIADYFKNFDALVKEKLLENNDILSELENTHKVLKLQFNALKDEAEKTDVTFRNLVEAEETRQLKSFSRMEKRLLRAEKIKKSELLNRMEQLFLDIHPGKTWQERVFNFSVFFSTSGKEFIDKSYEEMNVENSELIILEV
ncbi:bacillithiol biosynthesis cysteine-adding enzyme BshC [Halpernia frigidisoli]|uniref:Putative cysteine ligase BshC n=1 Tax=Halpernia frigidisoli TaxID=1125876 RepID=A0A1I3GK64_9FLAO|nr:bacillithiol biosynthesis cysteine-adding enzyme BshC [Halpernia frigidisoli]SFI23895.1 bacillithiol biosynthesis cysteine-adding enzyme BshC [Halpernia frigidisoli]